MLYNNLTSIIFNSIYLLGPGLKELILLMTYLAAHSVTSLDLSLMINFILSTVNYQLSTECVNFQLTRHRGTVPTSEWAVTTQSVSNQLPGTGHHHATRSMWRKLDLETYACSMCYFLSKTCFHFCALDWRIIGYWLSYCELFHTNINQFKHTWVLQN